MILFIIHSYFKHGSRLTFIFFLFALLIATIKEGPMRINGALTKNPTMPYQFLITDVPVIMNILLAIAGCVFTSYLGLCLAQPSGNITGKALA